MRHLLCVLPLLLAAVPAQDKHTLRLALAKDKPCWLVLTSDMTMKMDVAGQVMETTMLLQAFTELKVVAQKDGVSTVEQKVYRMKIGTKSPMMAAVEFDSDKPGADAGMLAETAALVGKTVRMKVDARGRTTDIELPEGLGGAGRGGDDLRDMFATTFPEFPEQPVAIGGTWQTTQQRPAGEMGEMTVTITHKLVGVDQGKANLEQTMAIDTSKLQLPGAMKMNVGKAGGSAAVDLATGMFTTMDAAMAMDMAGEEGGMKMKIAMAMKSALAQTEAPAPKAKAEAPKAPATGK